LVIAIELNPVAWQSRAATGVFDDAQIAPLLDSILRLQRNQPVLLPGGDGLFRIHWAHGAVAKQVVIVPQAATEQRGILELECRKTARKHAVNVRYRDDDVDALTTHSHGVVRDAAWASGLNHPAFQRAALAAALDDRAERRRLQALLGGMNTRNPPGGYSPTGEVVFPARSDWK
jgi:hypothetical protein